jgi:hypothetical protein
MIQVNGVSSKVVVGIVVGAVTLLIAIGLILFLVLFIKRRKKTKLVLYYLLTFVVP